MTVPEYNDTLEQSYKEICDSLQKVIKQNFSQAESKIWHGHPVWFLAGNPIVGYSKQKAGIRLMFWSGADFDELSLQIGTGKFKDASIFYNSIEELNHEDIIRWLEKSKVVQWDYKNIIKNKGVLKPL
jgi:hypothetical protein